jgi:hypothetical protein
MKLIPLEIDRPEETEKQLEAIDIKVEIMAKVEALRFDPDRPPPPADEVFRFHGTTVGTAGNIVVITAKPGSGKTAIEAAAIAAAIGQSKVMGWQSMRDHGAVIHIDTEQSLDDFHRTVGMTALRRAGLSHSDRLMSYPLVQLSTAERVIALDAIIERAIEMHGSIHSIFIDGGADFVTDVNDSGLAPAFVNHIHKIANDHQTVVVAILHLNPDGGKMRGHFGSEIERKAETVLAIKAENETSRKVYTTKTRKAPIPESRAFRFGWCDEARMFIELATMEDVKESKTMTEDIETALEIAAGDFSATWTHGELVKAFTDLTGKSESTAKRFIGRAKGSSVILYNIHAGTYSIGSPARKAANAHQ